MQIERRAAVLEVRVDGRKLTGYAATFNTVAPIGDFSETIRAGAFAATLRAKTDVVALVDHMPDRMLGRTSSGTLRLNEDTRGLAFEIDVPETTVGADVLALARRRDLGGMSFGFRIIDEAWPDKRTRELRGVELAEISVITGGSPAYPGTSVQARGKTSPHDVGKSLTPAQRRRLVEIL